MTLKLTNRQNVCPLYVFSIGDSFLSQLTRYRAEVLDNEDDDGVGVMSICNLVVAYKTRHDCVAKNGVVILVPATCDHSP
jgi:hypothetical protein